MLPVRRVGAQILISIALSGCGGGNRQDGPTSPTGTSSTPTEISMIAPFVSAADMAIIREGFSASANAPWGQASDGIGLIPAGDEKPFQAVASGNVEDVRLFANERTGNWQVSVRVRYNSTYSFDYGFSPFSPNSAVGESQLASIVVRSGQRVASGDLIGRLRQTNANSNVRFRLTRDVNPICPEPYFTAEARAAILALLQKTHPGANMCY